MVRLICLATAATLVSCSGTIFDSPPKAAPPLSSGPKPRSTVPSDNGILGVGPGPVRRLTVDEYDNTLKDLLAESGALGKAQLPGDRGQLFDNDTASQQPSQVWVAALELVAEQAAARAIANPAQRAMIVGCTPSGPGDTACMRSFVLRVGRLMLRRALTAEEVVRFLALQRFAVDEGNFYAGVEVVLRVLLQHPEFLYRIEQGSPVPGLANIRSLSGYEMASRLSYFLWASAPSPAMLDLAEAGGLRNPEQVRALAQQMLADPRAHAQVQRFHAMWLGYADIGLPRTLADKMRVETNALVNRVVFERRAGWAELLRAPETFIDDTLAAHYGLKLPGSATPRWVSYAGSGRLGLLSHGSYLAAASGPADTSPTRRGKFLQERLLCRTIGAPPPEANVDEDRTPGASRCKTDILAKHAQGTCASCHRLMDSIGFGLENYDQAGRFRTTQPDAPECAILGDGEVAGVGSFNGPGQLGTLLAQSQAVEQCLVSQLHRFAVGRPALAADQPFVERLQLKFREGGTRFDTLLLDLVSAQAFSRRLITEE